MGLLSKDQKPSSSLMNVPKGGSAIGSPIGRVMYQGHLVTL
jgi:anti-sigma-K factor RskA